MASNAIDACYKAKRAGVDSGVITICMNETTVEIINEGWGIPIEIDEKEKIYIPEMIFGHMFSGSTSRRVKFG